MTTRRSYAGGAQAGALTAPISISDLDIDCDALIGWPDGSAGEFAAVIGRTLPNEEKVLVATRTGASLTVSRRGYDGTPPSAHAATEVIEHVHTAIDDDEANFHSSNPYGHGIPDTDRIVGLNKTQTLTNKTMDGGSTGNPNANTFLNIPSTAVPEVNDRLDDLEDSDAAQDLAISGNATAITNEATARSNADSAHVNETTTPDPHPQYLTVAEADLRYLAIPTGPGTDYLTQDEADDLYAPIWYDDPFSTSTTLFAASAGWTLNSVRHRRLFSDPVSLCDLLLVLTRSGAAITNPPNGNVNVPVAGVGPLYIPQQIVPMVGPTSVGRLVVAELDTSGSVTLQAIGGSSDFATSEQVSLHALYLVTPPGGP